LWADGILIPNLHKAVSVSGHAKDVFKNLIMKHLILFSLISFIISSKTFSQDTLWTESNKQGLINNYIRTQNEINAETKSLTIGQWNFKETKESWSIAEVLEHLNMWQLITQDHIRFMLYNGPQPELAKSAMSDSAATTFIYENKKHISPDLTIPTGQVSDKTNLNLFNSYCNRIIENIRASDINFRIFFRRFTDGYMTNMNQAYIIQYGHVDRHLRQIRRIKANANFPK
jgi:hypothetical protein